MLADFNFPRHFPEGGTGTGPYLPTILTSSVRFTMSRQTRSRQRAARRILNHWTPREVPVSLIIDRWEVIAHSYFLFTIFIGV